MLTNQLCLFMASGWMSNSSFCCLPNKSETFHEKTKKLSNHIAVFFCVWIVFQYSCSTAVGELFDLLQSLAGLLCEMDGGTAL